MAANEVTGQEQPLPLPESASHRPFPTVGIGASAGGLEALTELLEHLPGDPGMAFLLVLHLQPHTKSHMQEVLRRLTPMKVIEAADGMPVAANCIHLIPPNKSMTLTDGKLALQPRPPHGLHMPIDHLFRSLAEIQKSCAVGVLLSGEGTDGTLGFHAIKAAGGVTFAQDEKTAKHDAMPRSAINDGSVDYVLSPAQIARELLRLNRHPYTQSAGIETPPNAHEEEQIKEALALLRSGMDVDFTHYKRSTIKRRIQRRMAPARAGAHRRLYPSAQARHDGGAKPIPGFPHPGDAVLPRPGCVRGAQGQGLADAGRGPGGEYADPHLGGRLFDRRGGLLHRHVPVGVPERPNRGGGHQNPRHRHQRGRPRPGPCRRLRGQHRDRRLARAAAALLHPRRWALPNQQGGARPVRLLAAQHPRRPALLAPRHGELPQRADLHGQHPAKARPADPALRAQS